LPNIPLPRCETSNNEHSTSNIEGKARSKSMPGRVNRSGRLQIFLAQFPAGFRMVTMKGPTYEHDNDT
jgi:hypothetical protein